jgi:hypothetical protein
MYFAICRLVSEPNQMGSMVTGSPYYYAHSNVQSDVRLLDCKLGHWQVRVAIRNVCHLWPIRQANLLH